MRVLRAYFILFAAVLALAVACVWIAGCDDKPTEPEPLKPEKEHLFYFLDEYSHNYYAYSPDSGVVDSFTVPFDWISYSTMSADGNTIYISVDSAIFGLDLESRAVNLVWPNAGVILTSPSGKYLAVIASGLHILDATDYSVVFSDTMVVHLGSCWGGDNTFYGLYWSYVRKIYLDSVVTVDHIPLAGRPSAAGWMRVSPDHTKWYLMYYFVNQSDCHSIFEVLDVPSWTTVYYERLTPGGFFLEITPDGKYVWYTNSADVITFCWIDPPYEISVFDVEANSVSKRISTIGVYGDDTEPDSVSIRQFAISLDGRWLFGTPIAGNYFVLIDAEKKTVEQFGRLGSDSTSRFLTLPLASQIE